MSDISSASSSSDLKPDHGHGSADHSGDSSLSSKSEDGIRTASERLRDTIRDVDLLLMDAEMDYRNLSQDTANVAERIIRHNAEDPMTDDTREHLEKLRKRKSNLQKKLLVLGERTSSFRRQLSELKSELKKLQKSPVKLRGPVSASKFRSEKIHFPDLKLVG